MSKALSTAKVQSAREIKKKAKIKKYNKKITTIVIILIVIILLAVFAKTFILPEDKWNNITRFFSNNEFQEEELGITFYSIDFPIANALDILENDENINLIFTYKTNDNNYLTKIYKSINTAQSIFANKDKNTILIVANVNNKNQIVNCATNFGNIKISEEIDANKCKNLIDKPITTLVFEYPNPALKKSFVRLNVDKKIILVKSRNLQDLEKSLFLILKAMFSDYEDVLKNLDAFKNKLSNLNSNKIDLNTNNLDPNS